MPVMIEDAIRTLNIDKWNEIKCNDAVRATSGAVVYVVEAEFIGGIL